MIKRWDTVVELECGERISLILRGDSEEAARSSALGEKGYKGIKKIVSCVERLVEKTFPEPPKPVLYTEPKYQKRYFA